MSDERRLLLAMHRGHEPSAERLWALFAPRLLAYAGAVLPRSERDAAEDVVQRVFCSVLDRPRRELKQIEDVTAWLFRVTRNAAMNHARTERRERTRREASAANAPEHGEGDRSEAARRVFAAASALPEDQRDALLLRLVGGLTLEQAAAALGVNRNTLASRYRAAVIAVRAAAPELTRAEMEAEHA